MPRWRLAAGLLFVFLACKAKSFTPASNGDDAGSTGDDDGGACSCELPTTTSTVSIPCGTSACVGPTQYECTAEGTALQGVPGACGPVPDASFVEEECIPHGCTGQSCNTVDSCGQPCKCLPGVTCNPNGSCGNGCAEGFGEACVANGGTSTTCCSSGYLCFARDGGAAVCCAALGAGQCMQDTDCCDYPTAHCQPSTGTCG